MFEPDLDKFKKRFDEKFDFQLVTRELLKKEEGEVDEDYKVRTKRVKK